MKPSLVITGSQGLIGKILCKNLANEYDIYGIDRVDDNSPKYFKADISDFDSLKEVFEEIGDADYLIHLAADTRVEADWPSVLKNNIIGTRNVYECSRLQNVKRIIFASSNHTTGMYEGIPPKLHEQENPNVITTNDPVRPDGHYGTSKVFGEALARQYYELHGIQSICLRIGTVIPHDDPTLEARKRHPKTWLSHRDLIRLVRKSLQADVPFGIYYAISKNTGRFWDISNAEKELGYKSLDDGFKSTP